MKVCARAGFSARIPAVRELPKPEGCTLPLSGLLLSKNDFSICAKGYQTLTRLSSFPAPLKPPTCTETPSPQRNEHIRGALLSTRYVSHTSLLAGSLFSHLLPRVTMQTSCFLSSSPPLPLFSQKYLIKV